MKIILGSRRPRANVYLPRLHAQAADVLLKLHLKQVSDLIKRLRDQESQVVKTVSTPKKVRGQWETVIYHGPTLAPIQKTILRTKPSGDRAEETNLLG